MSDARVVAAFEGLVGSSFHVAAMWSSGPDAPEPPPPAIDLLLTEAVDLDHAGPFEQFRLTFEGPRSHPLEQATYVLDPAPGGVEAILLVPTAEHGEQRVYTASLSVRRPSTESVGP